MSVSETRVRAGCGEGAVNQVVVHRRPGLAAESGVGTLIAIPGEVNGQDGHA